MLTAIDEDKPAEILGLPAPTEYRAQSLELNGPSVQLVNMGPVVVAEDGTLSRINNWHELTPIEQASLSYC